MGARAVPRAVHRFRVQRHDHSVLLGDLVQDVSRDPQIVSCVDTQARSHLNP
ncbi:hypothetical protein X777_09585 [Ooceraea biroi]|uniref:Uncharacterized protein n=1 Tax=Ooceraea biroi TaxID=2015173 RepID=A0A026W672_OOCBI|nr:hypothetical protein X777_09585 [Ooceraea biroi]